MTKVKKPWNKIEGLEQVSDRETHLNYTKDETNSVLGSLFDNSFEKRVTQVERNIVYPPHPYARLGDLSDETKDPESLFDKQKDVNIVWNKCTEIQIALGKREYGKLDEILAGNETDPKEIETKKQELPHFILLAHLGYCISMKYICEQKNQSVPLSLEQEIKEVRELAYDFAMAATKGNISDREIKEDLKEKFYLSIDYISELFAERFAEDAIQKDGQNGTRVIKGRDQGTERLSFYNAMVHSGMRKFIQMMFVSYMSSDKKLIGFKNELDIAQRLNSLISNMGKDADYAREIEDRQNAYLNGDSEKSIIDYVNQMRKGYGTQEKPDNNRQKPD